MFMVINEFQGEYRWLSNFWKCPVYIDQIMYTSSEAAFQAYKTKDKKERLRFTEMGPGEAKKAGKLIKLREDWEKVKLKIMTRIVLCKFTQNRDLMQKLILTRDAELIEGNTWGDKFWGVCNGEGENWLGRILMDIRQTLQDFMDYYDQR